MAALDALYGKVAKKVLSETLSVRKGEAVTVETWSNGLGFARAAVAEARAMGCTAMLLLEDEEAYIEGLKRAPRDTVGLMGGNEIGMLAGTDAYVFVPGPLLGAYQTKVDPKLMADSTRYNGPWYEKAEKAKLRGARLTFGYIGEEMAGMLGKTVDQIVERQLKAALVDLGEISVTARRVSSRFSDGAEGVLTTSGSTLAFALKGEPAVEDGTVTKADVESGDNMAYVPPGFVNSQVDPKSASGTMTVSRTLTRLGIIEDASLKFKEGRLMAWKSRRSGRLLGELLKAVPEDQRRLTVMNVGVNPKMGYLYGQDRMPAGSVTLGGFGMLAVARGADLSISGKPVVQAGSI
jgi:leucyl aminopeptidase (aminopeptidase T)